MRKLLILLFIVLSGTQVFPQSYQGDKEAINTILSNIKLFSEYYTSANYEALANSYCRDGVILPPGADIIKGREDIKKRWILPEGVSVPYHKITPSEITVKEDWAYDIGYYEGTTIQANGEKADFKGKYVIVWKNEEGDWKIYADAWNRVN